MPRSRDRPQLQLSGVRRRGGVQGAVLALNGSTSAELRRADSLVQSLSDRCLTVAVDGGLQTCTAARRTPDLFVGDGDSVLSVPVDIPSILYDENKDFSDLAGALRELSKRGVQVVAVSGLLGGRVDHEWSNLFELGRQARQFAGLVAPTERGLIVVTGHGCRMTTVRRRTVSLFSLGATATVSLRGTRWELLRRRLRPGSHGLSNCTGTRLDLTVHSGVVALVLPA